MVRSTTSTTTVLTSSASTVNNSQLQSSDFPSLDSSLKSNLEKLKYFERCPVYIFPNGLLFYANDDKSFRREVKLVNPCDWRIKFKIFSTSPNKWEVNPPEGSIGPNSTIFISIRLLDTSSDNIGMNDHLRLSIKTEDTNTKLGNRDLPVAFLEDKNELEKKHLEQLYGLTQTCEDTCKSNSTTPQLKESVKSNKKQSSTSTKSDAQGANSEKKARVDNTWPPPFYMLVALVCGIVLCLPSEAENKFPTFMRVSNTPKFVAAYVLGILTSLLCKYY